VAVPIPKPDHQPTGLTGQRPAGAVPPSRRHPAGDLIFLAASAAHPPADTPQITITTPTPSSFILYQVQAVDIMYSWSGLYLAD